ncbi:hypothetical protein BUE76_20560 [Cnuella takakiae]|nr:hypothetical protein BUE76_20560 [Cnuella takakiae]
MLAQLQVKAVEVFQTAKPVGYLVPAQPNFRSQVLMEGTVWPSVDCFGKPVFDRIAMDISY